MNISMIVDRQRASAPVTIRPRTPATWIPDSRVTRCFRCGTMFKLWRRRHHCRCCGRVFCASCSQRQDIIPSYFKAYGPSFEDKTTPTPQRTCIDCSDHVRTVTSMEWLIRMISLLPVHMRTLYQLRLVNREWNHSVNTMLGVYRGLQYKLPCQPYSSLERDFLWTHRKAFQGHTDWLCHLFASMAQQKNLDKIKCLLNESWDQHSCAMLLCSRMCSSLYSVEHILKLHSTHCLQSPTLQAVAIDVWTKMHPIAHKKMMFWWIHIACLTPSLFKDGLIPYCCKDLELLYAMYFECALQCNMYKASLLKKVIRTLMKSASPQHVKDIHVSFGFRNMLLRMANSRKPQNEAIEFFMQHSQVRLPWEPSKICVHVTYMKRLTSSSRPFLFKCSFSDKSSRLYLFKLEDVRTDRLAMAIGYWINILTSAEVHTYTVFPITQNCGVVRWLENTQTILEIQKSSSILNYILTNNMHVTVAHIRRQIISSCVGSCLLGFTMGVGDRHLENILVSTSGQFIHVDYGFILGDDPKQLSTPIRITRGMIDALGGVESSTYAEFTRVAKEAYNAMRYHASFWYHLLSSEWFICRDKRRHWKRVRDHVLNRFVPGEWNEQAEIHIEEVVSKASTDSWKDTLTDLTHSAARSFDIFQMEL